MINPVINPLMQGDFLTEMPLKTAIQEFLFRLEKDGSIFWVGVALPLGTTDFTRVQVFFHPTVVQAGTVHAADADYPAFGGGWSRSIQRYVAMEGGQLAGARLLPLLVPFTTMGALNDPAKNMFSIEPLETLNAVLTAVQAEVSPFPLGDVELSKIGVSSFSSGIGATRKFIETMKPTGTVQEVTDFDSPFIIAEPKHLTLSPGAVSRCYTQVALPHPPVGWIHLAPNSFSHLSSFKSDPHACIGWMLYFAGMLSSVIV
ncbi:hypothetical protein [Arthrobacter sp. LAR12-1-1.1]|uniref:hypothetical protein n=1 Tax=Arthrobacter sp. LAR12-1-1.1 TaxID=3135215 RepID=UPI00342AC099